jgi:hypothetical protein
MSVVQSVLLSAWLLPENGKSHPEPPPASLDECKRERKRNILALLAEDNRADALLVQEAIELHELPIELHVVEDASRHSGLLNARMRTQKLPLPT